MTRATVRRPREFAHAWLVVVLVAASAMAACKSERGSDRAIDDARAATQPADAAPTSDARRQRALMAPLPATRQATLDEINALLDKDGVLGNPIGVTWRLALGARDTIVFRGIPEGGNRTPRRYVAEIGALGERIGINRVGDRPVHVTVSCIDKDGSDNPTGYRANCFRDQMETGKDAFHQRRIWFVLRPGTGPAERLERLLMHALFTLDRVPPPAPRTKVRLPATRKETLDRVNKLLPHRYDPAWHTAHDEWRVEIPRPDTLELQRRSNSKWAEGTPKHMFSVPIDRLAKNLVVQPVFASPPELMLILSCRASPVVDGKVQGCIGWREYQYKDHVPGAKGSLGPWKRINSLGVLIPSSKKVAREVQALLHHALFTLDK